MTDKVTSKRSLYNNTSTPLGVSEAFVGRWEDVSSFDAVSFSIRADQNCTLYAEFDSGIDNGVTDSVLTYTIMANENEVHRLTVTRSFFRLRIVNGSSAQNYLSVSTMLGSYPLLTAALNASLTQDSDSIVTRSVITGQDPEGTFKNVKLDKNGTLNTNIANVSRTSFKEIKTASRFAQIELKSAVGSVSNLRNIIVETDGSVTIPSSGEYRVATSATVNAIATLQSGERGRYIPGYEAEAGQGIRIPQSTLDAISGTASIEWGYFDDDDGMGYGVDAGGVYIFVDRKGTRTVKVYQSNWNKDTLDGSGNANNPSGYSIDLAGGKIFQIEFVWYGYGSIQWYINVKDNTTERGGIQTPIHINTPDGATSLAQPNLPLTTRVKNGDQATALECFVGGRQFSIYGKPNQKFRINGERNSGVSCASGSWTPLISFRRKSGRGNTQSVELDNVYIVPDGLLYYAFVTGGTLTAASFGNLTDVATSETTMESDTSATAITGGTFLGGTYIALGSNRNEIISELKNLDFNFVNSDIVTLVARPVGGTSITVDAVTLNVREQW